MNPLEQLKPTELGRRLKAARIAAGITEEQAAAHINLRQDDVAALKRGDRQLSAEELIKLCDLYDTSPGRLLQPTAIHVDSFRLVCM